MTTPRLITLDKTQPIGRKGDTHDVPYPSAYSRKYRDPSVNTSPQTRMQWDMYWRWLKWHYMGVCNYHKGQLRKQRHAFTHMGLDDV
jgi:hypothetical protein